jgi:DNA replicative helicase MCM subunit Mcm2 (Cdc46/Mcm family)
MKEKLEDKVLVCKECHAEFVWTSGEQKFYADKNLLYPPARCKECRDRRKARCEDLRSPRSVPARRGSR